MLGTFQKLIGYAMFVAWIFCGLGSASVFSWRRREPDVERPFRVPGYPWAPALFVGYGIRFSCQRHRRHP
jgi:APA family basic amino acid/polyamine antiporter